MRRALTLEIRDERGRLLAGVPLCVDRDAGDVYLEGAIQGQSRELARGFAARLEANRRRRELMRASAAAAASLLRLD